MIIRRHNEFVFPYNVAVSKLNSDLMTTDELSISLTVDMADTL